MFLFLFLIIMIVAVGKYSPLIIKIPLIMIGGLVMFIAVNFVAVLAVIYLF
jgi:hypothetical protein